MFSEYYAFWLSFVFKLSHKLNSYNNKDHEDTILSNKTLLSDIIFEILPFRVYDHLFNCCRNCSSKNKYVFCTRFHVRERAVSDFLNKTLLFCPGFFPGTITGDVVLTNAVHLFVHYHGINHFDKNKDILKNYENKNIGIFYYDYINNPFTVYKFYLEVLCRIIFNNVVKKVLPKLIRDFDANNSYSCRQVTICNKKIVHLLKKKQDYFLLLSEKLRFYA